MTFPFDVEVKAFSTLGHLSKGVKGLRGNPSRVVMGGGVPEFAAPPGSSPSSSNERRHADTEALTTDGAGMPIDRSVATCCLSR
jgi:hypothetical protein